MSDARKSNGTTAHARLGQFSANPVLGLCLPMWRSKLVIFLMFTAFLALIGRALWIQGPGNRFYEAEGKKRFQHTLELPATHGKILDRNGLVLAMDLLVKAIQAVPENVPNNVPSKDMMKLAKLLDMNNKELSGKLGKDKRFVYLKRQVLPDMADQIATLKIKGIYQMREYRRFCPEGETVVHIVSFTNMENKGQEDMELARESDLAGVAGQRQVIKDRLGRVAEDVGVPKVPRDGHGQTLSIDAGIQRLTFNELEATIGCIHTKTASAIVLSAQTGEVLALANYPTYDPNDRSCLSGEQLRNHVLIDTFKPGSMMRPITISLALRLKRVTPSTLVQTNDKYSFEGAIISDTGNYDALTVAQIIQHSSNIGTTRIAMTLKPQEVWDIFTNVGLGQAPKIGFPGAVAERLRPTNKQRRIEQATTSYGYGLSVSLFQIAHAYIILAHDDELIPIMMYRTNGQPPQGERVISPEVIRQVRQMPETATAPGGTAPQAQAVSYHVGDGTGTAWKHTRRSYDRSKYRTSFIGLTSMSNPHIIMAVSVGESTVGNRHDGGAADPVFSQIVGGTLRALSVPPDSPIRQLVMTPDVSEEPAGGLQ